MNYLARHYNTRYYSWDNEYQICSSLEKPGRYALCIPLGNPDFVEKCLRRFGDLAYFYGALYFGTEVEIMAHVPHNISGASKYGNVLIVYDVFYSAERKDWYKMTGCKPLTAPSPRISAALEDKTEPTRKDSVPKAPEQ